MIPYAHTHPEEVERRVEDPRDRLLEKLLEDAVLVDARLVQALLIHELHPDQTLHRVGALQCQLPVPVL